MGRQVVTRMEASPHLILRCPSTILLLRYILNEDYVKSPSTLVLATADGDNCT